MKPAAARTGPGGIAPSRGQPPAITPFPPRAAEGAPLGSAYVFARTDQRYVAYSAFLDGNLSVFGRSPSVEKDPLVTDLQAGAVLGGRRWRFSVTYVDRSPEFRRQNGHQNFLSFAVTRRR